MKIISKIFLVLFLFTACKKDSLNTSAEAIISTSVSAIHFDTVFTSVGSATQSFKIFNQNNQKIHIDKIELANSADSFFHLNINGNQQTSFSGTDLNANDSMYVFVSVNINPNHSHLPFLIQDSILIRFNNNVDVVSLDAYGKNAHFINNLMVTKDSIITNDLPIVILDSLVVGENATLTINKGVEIYFHQNAGMIVNGSLHINGETDSADRVLITGDRLDDPYKTFPASWQGITFTKNSTNNYINSTDIKNAVEAIYVEGKANAQPQLQLKASTINNILNEGIKAVNSNVYAENCLITNCGSNNISLNAGTYNFIFCTVASYSSELISNNVAVLHISDTINNTQTATLSASFTNDIFYGSEYVNDEIEVIKQGNNFTTNFENVLSKTQNQTASFVNSIINEDPQFVLIDPDYNDYDFHLSPGSPCVDAGKPSTINTDLNGKTRTVGNAPDLGCYELQ